MVFKVIYIISNTDARHDFFFYVKVNFAPKIVDHLNDAIAAMVGFTSTEGSTVLVAIFDFISTGASKILGAMSGFVFVGELRGTSIFTTT
jgi:hypothetical protein